MTPFMQALADQQPRKQLYAIFHQDRYVGLSCAESAIAAIDLHIEVDADYHPGRVLVGPWMAILKSELKDARSNLTGDAARGVLIASA